MAKNDDKIELVGKVKQAYPRGRFLVELTSEGFEGHEVQATLSGKMRINYIRLVPGDRVKVQVSPYNLHQGLITYRER